MSPASCRIGLVGFGTVGSAVARRLVHHRIPNLALTHIFDRRAPYKRRIFEAEHPGNPDLVWTDRIDDVLTSNVDVIVEAVGGVDPAADWIRRGLLAGKSVVTSNKQAVAHHGPSLQALAARQGRQLRFEAAVGGAMPIVRAILGRPRWRPHSAHHRHPERHHQCRPLADRRGRVLGGKCVGGGALAGLRGGRSERRYRRQRRGREARRFYARSPSACASLHRRSRRGRSRTSPASISPTRIVGVRRSVSWRSRPSSAAAASSPRGWLPRTSVAIRSSAEPPSQQTRLS